MPAPPDMAYWMGQKYAILGKQAEGEYQRNIADAYRTREEGGQVAPNAASLRELQAATGFNQRGEGQLRVEQAATEKANRYLPPEAWGAIHDRMTQGGYMQGAPQAAAPPPLPAPGASIPAPATEAAIPPMPVAPAWSTMPSLRDQLNQIAPAPVETAPPPIVSPAATIDQTDQRPASRSALPPLALPDLTRPLSSAADLTTGAQSLLNAATPTLKAKKAGQAGSTVSGFKRGSANVGGGKAAAKSGGKGGKGAGGGGGGLESILPTLMAAAQGPGGPGVAPGPGAGAAGPGAADALPQAPASGVAAAPGFARGAVNVRHYADGTSDVSIGGLGDSSSMGFQGAGSQPAAPSGGGVTAGSPAPANPVINTPTPATPLPVSASPAVGVPTSRTPGVPNPVRIPGFAEGTANVPIMQPTYTPSPFLQALSSFVNTVSPTRPMAPLTRPVAIRGATGLTRVLPNPGYPFGAGYLFGATAVPGQGSGTVDKVPAMLAPHEAVLNKAAADKLGRGKIAALNAQGAKQMGLSRGAPR